MPVIAIKKTHTGIDAALDALLAPFASTVTIRGHSVLIKPNLVEPEPYTTGQTTNPALVEAIACWCKKQGASRIAIGEGPSYFQPASDLQACFTRTGMTDVAARQGIDWILFDDHPYRTFRHHSPRLPETFSLSEHAFCWDHIINVPVPKTHYLTTVSIAMKNLKGFIKREQKPSFHYCGTQGIHGSVTDLNLLIRPALNIVDCTAPTHRNKNFILAGTDIVAVDAVTASLMGFNPQEIRTIMLGSEAGLGEMDITKIDITGDDIRDLAMSFEQPLEFLRRAFPLLTLRAQAACSGCLIPLFASLRRLEDLGIRPAAAVTIAVGRQTENSGTDVSFCIGRCAKIIADERRWLQSCPPTKEELFAFLSAALQSAA